MKIFARDVQLLEAGASYYDLATAWYWFARSDGQYDRSRISLDSIDYAFTHMDTEPPLFVMNIEQWDLAEPTEREHGMCNLRVAALRARYHLQHAPIAFYRLLPERNYWAPVKRYRGMREWNPEVYREGVQSTAGWQQRNSANAADLLGVVNIICPSLYDFYEDSAAQWRHYADANLDEARRIAQGRPVIPFVSPQIAGARETLPLGQISMQLEFCAAHGCDGAVIYESNATGDWREPIVQFMKKQVQVTLPKDGQ